MTHQAPAPPGPNFFSPARRLSYRPCRPLNPLPISPGMSNGATKYAVQAGVSIAAGLATLALWNWWLKPKAETEAAPQDQGGWWPW